MPKDTVNVNIIAQVKDSINSLKSFAIGVAAAVAAVKTLQNAIKGNINAYAAEAKAQVKLGAALRATGNQIGYSVTQLSDMANEMANVTVFANEAVTASQGVMATFTQIGKEVFPDAISAAADMSTMFGQDLQQSVIQLGTALNDPIAGIGRLKRIGISFTDDQKASIDAFMEQNDVMSAQRVILDELKAEFGGVAEAMGGTALGSLERLGNAWTDLREVFGESLAEALKGPANDIVDWVNENRERISSIVSNFPEIAKVAFLGGLKMLREVLKPSNLLDVLEALGMGLIRTLQVAWDWLPKIAWERIKLLSTPFQTIGVYLLEVFQDAWTRFKNIGIEALQAIGLGRKLEQEVVKPLRGLDDLYEETVTLALARAETLAVSIGGALKAQVAVLGQLANDIGEGALGVELAKIREEIDGIIEAGMQGKQSIAGLIAGAAGSGGVDAQVKSQENLGDILRENFHAIEQESYAMLSNEAAARRAAAAQAELTEEVAKNEAVFAAIVPAFEGIGAAMIEGGKSLGEGLKQTFVGLLQMLAQFAAAQGALALAVGQYGKAGLLFAAAAAATIAAGAVGAIALAQGGIVRKPTLALIGEAGPEAVVPLGSGGGFGGMTVNIHGSVISEDELYSKVIRRMEERGRIY